MNSGVQITLIICLTIVAVIWICAKYGMADNDNKKKK